jgi:Tfp pilus assembly protein PilO
MEQISPALFTALALVWAVLVGITVATVWVATKIGNKVDWKEYRHDQDELKASIAEMRKDIAVLGELKKDISEMRKDIAVLLKRSGCPEKS